MIRPFLNILRVPELQKRLLFTMGLLVICRLVSVVPMPGVDAGALAQAMRGSQEGAQAGFLGFLDLFTGGALMRSSVGALSIWPYISASIVIQLLTAVFGSLKRLSREGDVGRQKLNQYMKYLTLVVCVVQGAGLAMVLQQPQAMGVGGAVLVRNPGLGFTFTAVLTMTTGTMLLVWLGDQITERGLGNGVSIIITVSIISSLPDALRLLIGRFINDPEFTIFHLTVLLGIFFVVTAVTVFLTQGIRRVPIHSTRGTGRGASGDSRASYMPLRVNMAGVMPIIFAGPVIEFPAALLRQAPAESFLNRLGIIFQHGSTAYMVLFSVLILFFSFFWVSSQFNPREIADDLKRGGSYIPGVRSGSSTASFLDATMTRITLIGALMLMAIAVIPSILVQQFDVSWIVASFLGGTSLLIIVGVMLDTMRQIEAHLVEHKYPGFLTKGRLRARR